MSSREVLTVADARSGLSEILRRYRQDPQADAVIVGARRRPEIAIIPFDRVIETQENTRESVRESLERQSALIRRIASFNRLTDVAVFGSVARGEENADSDIDLLVTPTPEASLFDLAQFEIDMEQLSGRAVEVVSRRALDARRDAHILAEAVAL
jgi:predicted nucleotidyltransferase